MVSRAPGLAHSLPSHVKWKSSCSGKCRHTQECLEMSEESWGPLIMSGCQVPAAKSSVSHLSWLPELGCGLWYGGLSPCLGGAVYKQCISVTAVGRRREHGRLQGEYQQAGTNGLNPLSRKALKIRGFRYQGRELWTVSQFQLQFNSTDTFWLPTICQIFYRHMGFVSKQNKDSCPFEVYIPQEEINDKQ